MTSDIIILIHPWVGNLCGRNLNHKGIDPRVFLILTLKDEYGLYKTRLFKSS